MISAGEKRRADYFEWAPLVPLENKPLNLGSRNTYKHAKAAPISKAGMEGVATVMIAGAAGLVFAEALKTASYPSRDILMPEYDEYENVLTEHAATHKSFASNETPVDRILSWISFRFRTSSLVPLRLASGRGFRRACRRITSDLFKRASLGLCRNRQEQVMQRSHTTESCSLASMWT